MGIPGPLTEAFAPAPPGKVRVVAWRQRTPTWPHPDLAAIHSERATLLHWWADAYEVKVAEWGETDAARPAEYVELLIGLVQGTLTAALGALATGYVQRWFERRKAKTADKSKADRTATTPTPPASVRPLMGLTIVNEGGGTVIVLDGARRDEVVLALEQVVNPEWRDRLTV